MKWDELAKMGDSRAVIDSNDTKGKKNQYINLLHHMVLSDAIGQSLEGKQVLDLGCGIGRFTRFLKGDCKANVTGVDSCRAMLEFNKGCKVYCSPITKLPFEDNSFDAILSVWTLQYILDNDLDTVASEMLRVLKPGGSIYLIEQMSLYGYDTIPARVPGCYSTTFDGKCIETSRHPIAYSFSHIFDLVRIGILPPCNLLARWHFSSTSGVLESDGYTDFFMSFKKENTI